jgi:diguanylate cyclase (GGDEF)-like protein/PAS domain S-box-containing protein
MNQLLEALQELPAPSPYRYAVRLTGLALAYFVAARIGLEYAVTNPVISTVWPASGIALAVVLLGGLRLLPAVFIGAFAVNYSTHGAIAASAITGLGNSLEVLLGTLLLRRVLDFDVRVSRLRDVVCLIVAAATIAPLPAALLGPLSLALFGGLAWPEFIHAFRIWWMGDSLGIVVVAPLVLTWAARPALDWGSPRFWYVTVLLTIQLAACYAVFSGLLINDFGLSRVTYFVLPFAVWIALAHDIRFTALANAGLFAIAVWGTAHGAGPFAGVSVEIDLILLHIFLVVYSITTLLVAAVLGERNRAVRDADSNAQRFRSLSELSSDWYWEQDQNLRFTSISGSANDRAGLSGAQSIGKTRFELPNEFESEEVRRHHAADLSARRPFRDLVLKRFRPDGEVHYALISGQPIFDTHGAFMGYRGVGRDITALKLAELALQENEERLRLQFQDMPIACIILDKSFLITDWNPAAERIFGFTRAEVIGRSPFDLIIPEHARPDVTSRIRELQQGESSSDGINENITKSGNRIICKWHNTVLSNADGELKGYMSMAEDVTAMVRAERAIRESEERFRALTALSSDWYWEQDEQLRFSFLSSTVAQATGVPADRRIGIRRWEIPGLVFDQEQLKAHQELLGQRKPFHNFVYRRVMPDGSIMFVSVTGSPIFDAAGNFKGYRGIGRDVTADVVIEQRVARLRDFYAALSKANEAIIHAKDEQRLFDEICEVAVTHGRTIFARICLINADTGFLDNVAVFGDHQGYPYNTSISVRPDVKEGQGPAGIALRTGTPYVGNDIQADDKNHFWLPAMLATGARAMVVFPLRRAGKVVGSLHLYAAEKNWFDEELVALIGELVANISFALDNFERERARQRTEAALKESEERFRSLTDLSNDWYWEQDQQFRNTYMSPRYSARTGMAMKSTLGETRFETDNIWESEEVKREHRKVLDAHLPFRDLHLARRDENGELHFMLISGEPVFGPDGKFTGYRGVGKDITAQKSAEIRVARLRDFYAVLSEVNNVIIHAQDRSQLFTEVCKAVVEHGRLQFVRIAMLDPSNQQVRTVAHRGDDHGLAARLYFSMDPNVPEGRAPSTRALREGHHFICNNVAEDKAGILGKELLLAAGLHSVATFPLPVGGAPAGALHLYATEPGFFDAELVNLIDKLAQNVSFALNNFEREAARRAAEKALRDSEQRFRDIAQAAGEYVWENDNEGQFTYLSPRVVEVLGHTAEELVGHSAAEFMPADEPERVRQWFADNMKPDRSFRGLEHKIISKSGETLWLHISGVATSDERGNPTGHRGTARDVTEIKESEARISYLATRDPLTELPNRLLFNDRLEQGIINARRKGDALAVLFVDLDRFKNINDSLGHHVGDLLLKEVASQMTACIRKGDTLSRLGGDEFVVTLEGLSQAEDAAQVALKIIRALAMPLNVGGHTLNTTCSIGISIFPNDAEDGRELMKNADTAMYHAKERGRNNFQFFSPEMNVRAVERHQLETEMRRALEFNQFVLHYQPQADMRTGKLVGMEALIRWHHPERGLVPPSSFIPVAEESGLIELIGRWALKTACEQNREWQARGLPTLKVAVNISTRQFNDPRGFANEITRLLNATGLDPRYLELEMTESMLLKNVDENIAVLRRLGKLGTRLAVDDFGTGYSSLAYLKQLPIDTLKIDRTFVRDIETDADDAAIIGAIIAMAHGLDVRVTAEGVETKGQVEALRKLGCDEFQGFLLSKPLPVGEFAAQFLAPQTKKVRKAAASARASASRGRARRA